MISKTAAVEAEVEEVKTIVDQNLQNLMERGENLNTLEKKTGKS